MKKLLLKFIPQRTEWLVQDDGFLWISIDGKAVLFA
jgi:hypothetical protein